MASLVSVILPVFNREQFLVEAIESVLGQTYENFELLISDNCSTDSSFEIINRFAKLDSRIKHSRHGHNIGCAANYNSLIAKASGKFIALFGSDDIFEPSSIENLVLALESNPSAVLATGARNILDSSGKKTKEVHPFNRSQLIPGETAKRDLLLSLENWIAAPVLWHSAHKGQGFDYSFVQYTDLDYWCRLMEHGDIYYLDEILLNYRIHERAQTVDEMKNVNVAIGILRIHDRYRHVIQTDGMSDSSYNRRITNHIGNLADYFINHCHFEFKGLMEPPNLEHIDSKSSGLEISYEDFHDYKRAIAYAYMLIADQIKTLRELHQQVDELGYQIAKLTDSKSWRVTEPLRQIKAKLKKDLT